MNSWYDMAGIGVKELREDVDGIEQSVAYIHALIDAEVKAGTPAERIIVGGFSQGGCLALAAAFKYPQVRTLSPRIILPPKSFGGGGAGGRRAWGGGGGTGASGEEDERRERLRCCASVTC